MPEKSIRVHTIDGSVMIRPTTLGYSPYCIAPDEDTFDNEVMKCPVVKELMETKEFKDARIGFCLEYEKPELLAAGSIEEYTMTHPLRITIFTIDRNRVLVLVSQCRIDISMGEYPDSAETLERIVELSRNAAMKGYLLDALPKYCADMEILQISDVPDNHLDYLTKHYGLLVKNIINHPFVKNTKIHFQIGYGTGRSCGDLYLDFVPDERYKKALPNGHIEFNLRDGDAHPDWNRATFVKSFNCMARVIMAQDIIDRNVTFEESKRLMADMPELKC